MVQQLQEPIPCPQAWEGHRLSPSDWALDLPGPVLEELYGVAERVRERRLRTPHFGTEAYSAPEFAKLVPGLLEELESGKGFVLLRGLDLDALDDRVRDAGAIYWAMGLQIGPPVSQNVKGELLGSVRNEGGSVVQGHYRGSKSGKELTFHTDNSDATSLLCVRKAASGGLSSMVSSMAVHNYLLENSPEVLPALYEPIYFDWRGEEPEGWKPYYRCPIFSYYEGRLSARYVWNAIKSAQEKYAGVIPPFSDQQRTALEAFAAAAEQPALKLDFQLEHGDVLLFNNYTVMHSRTEYQDAEELELRRHLMRLWFAIPNSRPLAPDFVERYGVMVPGEPRGGYKPRL